MGFLDKIKAIKNAVTGGGAQVYLEVDTPSLTEPFPARITAQIGDADLKIKRVYLRVRAEEEVEIPDVDVAVEEDGERDVRNEMVRRATETVRLEIPVSGPETLSANEKYEWECEIALPANALPTFRGVHAHHTYAVQAGLDCFGNDPDSGWLEIEVH